MCSWKSCMQKPIGLLASVRSSTSIINGILSVALKIRVSSSYKIELCGLFVNPSFLSIPRRLIYPARVIILISLFPGFPSGLPTRPAWLSGLGPMPSNKLRPAMVLPDMQSWTSRVLTELRMSCVIPGLLKLPGRVSDTRNGCTCLSKPYVHGFLTTMINYLSLVLI